MKTESPERCQHIAIAHSSSGHITICPECKVVHVAMDHVTLRFTPEVFRGIAHMFASAQARLDHASAAGGAAAVEVAASGGPSLH
jgi:hypothetical protein